jgi:hypothetical protein
VDNADSYNLYWDTTGGVSTSDNSITGIQTSSSGIIYYHSGLSMFRSYSYIVTAVNTVGESSPSNEVSAIPSDIPEELLKRIASDAEDGDTFCNSVAISGDYVVVGAMMEDAAGTDRGAAYIFARNQDGLDAWGEVAILTASNAEDGDYFGRSVAISGDYVVVSANKEDGAAGTDRGAAYVFDRNFGGPDAWGEAAILTASDTQDGDEFGCSVSIGGDFVVVGADHEDGAGTDRGAAYVFDRNQDGPDTWGEAVKLTALDAEDGDLFGWSVAISSDSVVIGAPYEGDVGVDLGAAYVYHQTQGILWKLTALDAEDGDLFGYSVSVSINGDYVVVGAPFEDSTGTDLGAVYIY